jgi:signal transduction histidine kinase
VIIMSATMQRATETGPASRRDASPAAWWPTAAAVVAVGLSGWAVAAAVSRHEGPGEVVVAALAATWAVAAVVVARRPATAWVAAIVAGGASAGAVAILFDGVRPVAAALAVAAGLHLLVAMPDGRLRTSARRILVWVGYAVAVGVGAVLAAGGGSPGPVWAVVGGAAALLAGAGPFAARFGGLSAADQRRMKWLGWGVTVAAGAAIALGVLRLLVGWPPDVGVVIAAVTAVVPLSLVLASFDGPARSIDSLLTHTVSLAGLAVIVAAVYVAVVLGLGRVPKESERTLLLLSLVAAALAALLYVPARTRLKRAAARLTYGGATSSDEILRTFGTRMSRAIPLDELMLQMTESLRSALTLHCAEMWSASPGVLELVASDPERQRRSVPISASEEATVARAGVSGQAWARLWLPALVSGREEFPVRVAPVTHSGELLGLIVAERAADAPAFESDDDRVLAELARQVGLTLHNVRLDSALQASLDEVRRQAQELQASRGRIVAAGNLERRRIERNLHDGAQQHLVAIAVKLRLARQLSEKDPAKSGAMLEELGHDIEEATQQLRDLAHGIYPPLLADRGLGPALESAARRAALPVRVEAEGVHRHEPEVEATIYFCCLEGLQNAGKYAGEGATAVVRVWEESGALLFEVSDDGAGFDVSHRASGAGFTNMNDRLGAVGGTLRVESTPGRGTRVRGTIPVEH